MKKFILLCLMILMGCSSTIVNNDFEIKRCQGIEKISYEQVSNYIENNVDFILYIGRSDCGDCIEFHPILEKYLQEHSNLGVYYLDVKEFRDKANSENATQEEKDFFKNIYTTLDFDWTPTLQHRRGKQVLSKITYLSMDYYEIEDQTQQEETKQENIQEIYTWLEKECE